MHNWRKKIWFKIVALTICGVFLFSELTWAARTDVRLSLPPDSSQNNTPQATKTNFNDIIWEFYKGVSSFLIPSAHAAVDPDEILFKKERTMSVYNYKYEYSRWGKPAKRIGKGPAMGTDQSEEQV